MKKYFFNLNFILLLFLNACTGKEPTENINLDLNTFMSDWHLAATNADTTFFEYLSDDAIYIGTDASERWTKSEFVTFALPYFKKGKAWDFKTRERQFYFADNEDIVWFDETLDTWMGICRSSGILKKNKNNEWKIKHYHLSCTVPNEKVRQFIELVTEKKEEQSVE